jgi:hypothetical protein
MPAASTAFETRAVENVPQTVQSAADFAYRIAKRLGSFNFRIVEFCRRLDSLRHVLVRRTGGGGFTVAELALNHTNGRTPSRFAKSEYATGVTSRVNTGKESDPQ